MVQATTALAVAFAGLLALLATMNLRAALPWPVKAVLNLAVAGFLVVGVGGLRAWLGWPAGAMPPAGFRLHAHLIEEPRPADDFPGGIYLWLGPDHPDSTSPPRAHALPYSRKLHELLARSAAELPAGAALRGRLGRAESPGGVELVPGLHLELGLEAPAPPKT